MKIFDIIFYSGSEPSNNDPRRIDDGEYRVEWHRKGVEFVRCPKGVLKKKGTDVEIAPVASGILVPLKQFVNNDYYEVVPDEGQVQCRFRVRYREYEKWLEKNSIPNNVNQEVLRQIADHYEQQWVEDPTLKVVKYSMERLREELPIGVDDEARESIFRLWYSRWEDCLINDLEERWADTPTLPVIQTCMETLKEEWPNNVDEDVLNSKINCWYGRWEDCLINDLEQRWTDNPTLPVIQTCMETLKEEWPNNVDEDVLNSKINCWYGRWKDCLIKDLEQRWAENPSVEVIQSCLETLKKKWPPGIDNDVLESVLEVWRRRRESCVIKDLLSYDDKVAAKAVAPFRRILLS